MKILAIAMSRIPAPNANGIQVMKVCSALTALGHEVTLLVPDMQPQRPSREDLARHYGLTHTFEVRWITTRSRRLFPFRAVHEGHKFSPDLLYTWSPQASVLGLANRLPVIFEAHEPPLGRFGPWWYRAFLRLPGKKRLAGITQSLLDILEADYGLPEERVRAPNGVDLDLFDSLPSPPRARRALGIADTPTVLCSGHLYEGRGVPRFLSLAEALPQVQFLWVGGRPQDVEEWRARASHLPNVRFLGFVPNSILPRYLAAAEILLAPYDRRIAGSSGGDSGKVASPMKIFDYLAAGRAILASDLPIIREILDEDNAVLCPPEEERCWVRAVQSLLNDDSLRERLAARARRKASNYTWIAREETILKGFLA